MHQRLSATSDTLNNQMDKIPSQKSHSFPRHSDVCSVSSCAIRPSYGVGAVHSSIACTLCHENLPLLLCVKPANNRDQH